MERPLGYGSKLLTPSSSGFPHVKMERYDWTEEEIYFGQIIKERDQENHPGQEANANSLK